MKGTDLLGWVFIVFFNLFLWYSFDTYQIRFLSMALFCFMIIQFESIVNYIERK